MRYIMPETYEVVGLYVEIPAAPQGFQQSNAAGGEQAERTQNDKEYSDKKQQKRIQRALKYTAIK